MYKLPINFISALFQREMTMNLDRIIRKIGSNNNVANKELVTGQGMTFLTMANHVWQA